MSIEAMKQALEALQDNKRSHYYCEDTWYSCPKHEDGCANEAEGDECNCGADKANEQIDLAITALRQAIEQAEKQEPVCVAFIRQLVSIHEDGSETWKDEPIYISPPRKEWVGLTDEELFELWVKTPAETDNRFAFARAIEAKLKEKNT
jgi:hypothetical protein